MADSANRTQFTIKALGLADLFNANVGDRRVSQHRVELSAPDGPSTGGGRLAVQHVKLVPDGNAPVIVAGSANQLEASCELRTFEHLAELHAQRWHGQPIPIDRVSYNQLLKRMRAFFTDHKFTVVLVDAARTGAPASRSRAGLMVSFFAVVLAVGGGVFFLLSLQR
jgi:hypothetical protein